MKKLLKDRFFIVKMCFLLIAFIIIAQLVNLQVIHGKENDVQSSQRLSASRKIPAPRGDILDKNGVKIATNRMGFAVQIIKTKLSNDELNDMLLRLANIFEKNNENFNRSISSYLTFNPIAFNSSQSQEKIDSWIKDTIAQKSSDAGILTSPEAVFNYIRNQKYGISSKYSDEEAFKIISLRYELQIRGYSSTNPLTLASDVSRETVAEIGEQHDEFPGVTTEVLPLREYIDAQSEAQVIGYVRGITQEQYKSLKDKGYDLNDVIGQSGVEVAAEEYLRGTNGLRNIEVNAQGIEQQETSEIPAIPGDNVILTMDTNLQKVAMQSLEKNINEIKSKADYKTNFGDAFAGAVVAMDVNSGEILAMASYPSYDPSIFLAGKQNKDAQKSIIELNNPSNESKPLLNRAIAGTYAPGSTFKPITAIAGLEENIITPDTIIRDDGVVNIGGRNFYSHEYRIGLGAQGNLNLIKALATSNNIFFHVLGYQAGINNIDKWASYFGLGKKTGIDIPGESAGTLASIDYKKKVFKDDWRPADTAQAAIGQLYNNFSPLQLADYAGALANGGKLYKPYLIKKIVQNDGTVVKETKPEYTQIPIKQSTIEAVEQGMVAVTNASDGTAATIFDDLPFKVAGKTGTAETGSESTHSSNALFLSYAPADHPQIAVAVIVERGAWGAYTAPVAHDILKAYFNIQN